MNPEYFSHIIHSYYHEPYASLINGIVFGIQLPGKSIFQSELKNVGLIHIVVLSGMNISIVSSFISAITRKFSKMTSCLITISVIILYTCFVRFQAPIVRSLISTTLTNVSIVFGKKSIPLYLLGISALVSLVLWPDWISSLSFYLSYGATLGLILFGPRREQMRPSQESFLVSYLKDELKTSLAAEVFTIPIILYYFRQVSLISPLSNILVSWCILPLTIFGMLTAVGGMLHYYIGAAFGVVTYGFAYYVVLCVHTLASVPFNSIHL